MCNVTQSNNKIILYFINTATFNYTQYMAFLNNSWIYMFHASRKKIN